MKKTLCILSIVFFARMLCASAYAAVEPVITANGMSGTVNIAADSAVTVRVQLLPGDKAGRDADWWLVAYAYGRWYFYQIGTGLSDIGNSLDIAKLRPVYQGKLFTLPSSVILQIPQVPAGTYSLYFGVDTNMNGKLDTDSLVFRELNVISGTSKALKSDLTRNMSPTASQDDLKELVIGNNSFALDFYQAISGKDGNIFFSPYSISMALAMTYAGAAGETEQQMKNTLHFTLPQDRLHSAFNALNIGLGSYAEETFKLNVANSIWGQSDYPFLSSFLDVIASNYGAVLKRTDFINAPEESRLTINNWVSDNTAQKINDLLPQGSIGPLTRLVLVNTIYFNAPWARQFEKRLTHDDLFYLADSSSVTLPMMRTTEYFRYAEGDGYKAVELPYKYSAGSMLILVPDSGKFGDVEKSVTVARLSEISAKLASAYVTLEMPKFKYESDSVSLKDTFSGMGMPAAFSNYADFSGIDGSYDLSIGNIFHKAFISVDEAGTEAAAATAVGMSGTSMPPVPIELKINRPFIYFIRDNNGTILFMGRMINPGN